VELQAGYGQGIGVTGTIGLKLNNFSLKQMFAKGGWSPIPSGDGQQLALSVETNGKAYTSVNLGFTEPWLGGKNPNSLTVDIHNSRYAFNYPVDNPAFEKQVTTGASVGLGKQLSWPDDFFTLISTVSIQKYQLHNYQSFPIIHDGSALELSFNETFGRNSVGPDLQFPKYGSNFYLSLTFTPPYSLFAHKDYSSETPQQKYQLVEFHKWRFGAEWYNNVFSKFVLHVSAKGGYLGYYNAQLGLTPFERFAVGGDPLSISGYTYFGVDFISQRGYGVYAPSSAPASIFNKFTAELRYPISSNPNAFIYAMLFAEAGNAWYRFNQYNPFDLKRAVGAGIRVYLPIFGIVGFDYGLPFDPDPTVTDPTKAQRPQTLGQLFGRGKFSIILGFEGQ
jgi:outer membrane protein insertion porin family